MYSLLRKLLFLLPAETAHYFSMNMLKLLGRTGMRSLISQKASDLPVHTMGLSFRNPVGLGAGFDKNALYLDELDALGFGFIEIGTVTPKPQEGNEKPRLFRLPKDKALINRMGFNNDGVEKIKDRLAAWRKDQRSKTSALPVLIGGNIGKNKSTDNEDAWKDYEICFTALHPYVDFFVVNVSSPNTPGLRALQEKPALKKILTHLQHLNNNFEKSRPILLKIAPDLEPEQIDDVIDLVKEINLDGLVATNTTISRKGLISGAGEIESIGAGGLSGLPVQKISTDVLKQLHQKTGNATTLIGSGGIFTGEDAKEKFNAGAVLVEVWTGFIYEGPGIVGNILKAIR